MAVFFAIFEKNKRQKIMVTPKEIYYRKQVLFHKGIIGILLICIGLLIFRIHKDSISLNNDTSAPFVEQLAKKDALIAQMMSERTQLQSKILNSRLEIESVKQQSLRELERYNRLSNEQKRELAKRFQKTPIKPLDSFLVCFDSIGVDSINRYVIVCEGVKLELKATQKLVDAQGEALQKDSSIINELTLANSDLKNIAIKEKGKADKEKQTKKRWRAVAITAIITKAAILFTVLR